MKNPVNPKLHLGAVRAKIREWAEWWRNRRRPKEAVIVRPPEPDPVTFQRDHRSESHTKKGPGRKHAYGPGKKKRPPKPDSLDPQWKLNDTSRAERERANALRGDDG